MMKLRPEISVIIPVYNNESYLSDTLDSLLAQTFRDFEAIVVNDGSEDGTEAIIDRYAARDKRIRKLSCEHRGVSGARNAGLQAAKGRYAAFLDGDDVLPENAYRDLYAGAVNSEADLVVGVYERLDGISLHVNERTMKLAAKKKIYPWDKDLVHSFEVWNKMFSMDIIRKNNIRFEDYKYLEDVIFTYSFLQHTDKISAVKSVIYKYCRRLAIFIPSATQAMTGSMMTDAFKALDRIEEITASWPQDFHKEMQYRFTNAILIREYYRHIWKLDDGTAEKLVNRINEIIPQLDPAKKDRIIAKCYDLEMENGFRTRDEIIGSPLITIYITGDVSAECVNDLLASLYGQNCPNFICVVDSAIAFAIDDKYSELGNIRFGLTRELPDSAYVLYADCDMMFDVNTLSEVYLELSNDGSDMAVMSAVDIDGKIIGGFEGCMGNKLVRTQALRDLDFSFKWADAFKLTEKLSHVDVKDHAIILKS
jgi:glycosyltransferase involved in cell wall biosynthesis